MDIVKSTHCYNDNARVVYLESELTPLEVEKVDEDETRRAMEIAQEVDILSGIKDAAWDVLEHFNYLDSKGSLARDDEPVLNKLRKAFGQKTDEEEE